MVWSFALCADDAKQDPVMYGVEFGLVIDTHPACAGPPDDFNGHIRGFSQGASYVSEELHLFVDFVAASTRTIVRGVRGGGMHMVFVFFTDTANAKARQTFTTTFIISASPCSDREIMQASSTYSMPHTT